MDGGAVERVLVAVGVHVRPHARERRLEVRALRDRAVGQQHVDVVRGEPGGGCVLSFFLFLQWS